MKLLVTTLVLALISFSSIGQTNPSDTDRCQLSIETDPSTFAFGGFAAHLRLKPKNSEHFLIGVGVYAMDMPSVLTELNPHNKGEGWNQRIEYAVGLFGEYHFQEVNQGWLVGGQLGVQEYSVTSDQFTGEVDYTTGLAMAYGGYSYQPFAIPIYLKGWAGIGYSALLSDEPILSGKSFDVQPVIMFATLHVGYTF